MQHFYNTRNFFAVYTWVVNSLPDVFILNIKIQRIHVLLADLGHPLDDLCLALSKFGYNFGCVCLLPLSLQTVSDCPTMRVFGMGRRMQQIRQRERPCNQIPNQQSKSYRNQARRLSRAHFFLATLSSDPLALRSDCETTNTAQISK